MPLHREQLDRAGCATPNCGHDHTVLFLSGECHPGASGNISYSKLTGTISVTCFVCDKPVAEVAVAD